MKRVLCSTFVSMFVLGAVASLAPAQAAPAKQEEKDKPAPEQKAPAAAEKATIVFLGNGTCPGDDKPVNREKFVEVEGQRIYVCCDECVTALKKDATAARSALAKAYPIATPVAAKACTCGKPIEAGKATEVTFQGHKVSLCCSSCASTIKLNPVTAIALLMHPTVKDAKNTIDPYDSKPIDATIVAIYKTHLVHLSSWTSAAAFEKDPATAIQKLKLSG
jgi:hypothetical protein